VTTDIRRDFSTGVQRRGDRIFFGSASAAAIFSFLIVMLILVFLGYRSIGTFKSQGLHFITGSVWDPSSNTFGIAPMLVGSLFLGIAGLLIAVPCSIIMAYFIEFVAPGRIARWLTIAIDLLAAIPSILIGFWGLAVFSPVAGAWAQTINAHFGKISFFQNSNSNFAGSPFIGAWILGVMMIPIITSVSREVMSRVDKELVNAAIALGGSSYTTFRRVILPTSKGGVLGGILIGLGRGLGETIAILYVLNLVMEINITRPLENRGGSVASFIAANWGEASGDTVGALLAAGVVLFILTLAVNFISSSIVQRAERKMAS
jgi:phosphate transport system permease protein